MKKILAYGFIIIFALAFLSSCKKTDKDIIVWRKITSQTMINGYGAYLFMRADKDSVLYSGIHVALIKAHIYNIQDTVEILKFGHIWSIDNANPTLFNSAVVYTSDSVSFSPNDSVLTYTSELTGLQLDTLYYARSFVVFKEKNSGKVDTAYNQVVTEFHTAVPRDIWFYRGNMKIASGPLESRTDAVVAEVYDSQNDEYKVYMGLGYNGYQLLDDFYGYDPETEQWSQEPDFPGLPRYKAVSFVIGSYIYVGTGKTSLSVDTSYTGDFYKFFPYGHSWRRVTNMPASQERYGAIAWSVYYNNQWWGFVGYGKRDAPRPDVYKYDYTKDSDTGYVEPFRVWSLHSFENNMAPRLDAIAVSNGEIVFLGGGNDGSGRALNDYYLFNPSDNASFLKAIPNVPFPARYDAVASYVEFSRDGVLHKYFYIGTVQGDDQTFYNDWYAYDLKNNTWLERSHIHEDFLEGQPRAGAISFVIKKKVVEHGLRIRIFVGGGNNQNTILNDLWEYLP